jgi:hypothetical protein
VSMLTGTTCFDSSSTPQRYTSSNDTGSCGPFLRRLPNPTFFGMLAQGVTLGIMRLVTSVSQGRTWPFCSRWVLGVSSNRCTATTPDILSLGVCVCAVWFCWLSLCAWTIASHHECPGCMFVYTSGTNDVQHCPAFSGPSTFPSGYRTFSFVSLLRR